MSLAERLMRRWLPLPEVLEPPKPEPGSREARGVVPGMWGPGNYPDPHGPDPVVFGPPRVRS